MNGIDRLATYVPRYAVSAETLADAWGQFQAAGVSTKAVPGGDEDTLTMAHEAGWRALEASSLAPEDVASLFVATTTPPTEEDPMGPRLASTLGLDESVRTRQFTGSTAAGVEALEAGLAGDEPVLVVTSDAPRGAPDSETEQAAGAAAVAAVLSPEADATATDGASVARPAPGTRFRPGGSAETTGLGITPYDRGAYTAAIGDAVAALDVAPSAVDALAVQAPNGKLPYRLAGPLGIDTGVVDRGTVVAEVGDTGAASPLLGLASAADGGAESIIAVGYGSGSATAVAIDGPIPVAGDAILPGDEDRVALSYGEYLRVRGEITAGEPEGGGAYVSVPSWRRTLPQRHRLVAGRCEVCGRLAFPPKGACGNCNNLDEYEAVRLPGTGTVEAATVIGTGGAPPEFVEQQARSGPYTSAVVALNGPDGGSVSIPAQVVGTEETVAVGDRVRATIRRIYTQEDVVRYGFKMLPLEE